MTDRYDDFEDRIRRVRFSNQAHKESLRKKILEEDIELSLDDLGQVAGGAGIPEEWVKYKDEEGF